MKHVHLPKVTVITVTYNAAQLLEETIKSVITQTYPNIEYIIIDGGSNDETVELIKKYHSYLNKFISEKDNGIYDAMNKGITLAQGEWINFLNAGDRFHSETTLSNIFENDLITDDIDIIVGSTIVEFEGYNIFRKAGHPDKLWRGTQFCHQSTFSRSNLHRTLPFNNENKIVADFEFFYRCLRENKKFHIIQMPISFYRAGGVSDVKKYQVQKDFFLTVFRYEASFKVVFFHLINLTFMYFKDVIKLILGKNILRKIRESKFKVS